MNSFRIANRLIGPDQPALIVAELSANHLQQFELACDIVRAAHRAGADAVKMQTYTPDTITIDCDKEWFQIKQGTLWDGQTLYRLYEQAYGPWEWQPKIMALAEELGMICFSSPFDAAAVEFLESMNVPAYKVASFEITDLPLVRRMASKEKPIILSTGIARPEEIQEAVAACREEGNDHIALLKCTSAYPAQIEDANLLTIPDLASRYGVVAGLSDHTMGTQVPVAAVVLGARIVEKHLTLSRSMGGPDAAFSLEPEEFGVMVDAIREAEKALGEVSYELSPQAERNRDFTRSLFVVHDIAAGEELTTDNIRSIRPGFGLPPKHLPEILGRRAACPIERGTPLSWELISSD